MSVFLCFCVYYAATSSVTGRSLIQGALPKVCKRDSGTQKNT